MFRSSGQFVSERVEWRECVTGDPDAPGCGHDAPVDVWYDPELRLSGWVCPVCGREFEEDDND